ALHVHLQRLLLGADADEVRRQATHRVRAQQPPGRVLHQLQPAGGRRAAGGGAVGDSLHRFPEALRTRPHAWSDKGLIETFRLVAEAPLGPGSAVYEHGWQSWSPTGV